MPRDVERRELDVRSEEVQDVLGHTPHWLVHSGTAIILAIILVLLVISWMIKYPDTLSSRIIVTSETPPADIVARSNGEVMLLVNNNALVEKETVLGVVENPAKYNDIVKITAFVERIKPGISDTTVEVYNGVPRNLYLGELQEPYLMLLKNVNEWSFYHATQSYKQQSASLEKRLRYSHELGSQLQNEIKILEKETSISFSDFKSDSILYESSAGSIRERNRSQFNHLQALRTLESAKVSVINNKIHTVELETQLTDLKLRQQQEEYQYIIRTRESFEQLQSKLSGWEQQYLLRTPIRGTVSFSKYWSDHQFVKAGEPVMVIVPKKPEIFGQLLISQRGSGKLQLGQRVNIKFDNYPNDQFGMVIGKIETISLTPQDDHYTVRVSFPAGLTSTYKKELEFKPQMQGSADVITKDLRLLERIFNQIRYLLDKAEH